MPDNEPVALPSILGYYRYRERGRPHYENNIIVHPDNPSAYGAPAELTLTIPTYDKVEAFYDSLPRKKPKSGRGVTYGWHGVWDASGCFGRQAGTGDEGHPYFYKKRKKLALRWPETGPGMAPFVPQGLKESFALEAFNYFSDVFPELLSFSEFLFGMTKLRELMPQIGDSISKTIAGGLLTKQFGWDNLLSDLDVLRTLFKDVTKRLAYLREIRGRGTRMHIRRALTRDQLDQTFFFAKELTGEGGWTWNEARTVIEPVSASAELSATCWLYETLEFIDGAVGFMRAMTGALGLNNPLKVLWVNMPLSFIVDEFLHVDRILDRYTRLNPVGGWDLTNISFTTVVRYRTRVRERHVWHDPGAPNDFGPWGTIDAVIYDRRTGLPLPQAFIDPGALSPNQLTLLLAMLHANSA